MPDMQSYISLSTHFTVVAFESGRSSIPERRDQTSKLRRTGYSAFAEYDGIAGRNGANTLGGKNQK
jgi:hypothetical protein